MSSPYLRDPGRAQAPPPGPLIRHRRLRRPHTGPGTPASSAQGRLRGQGASRKSCRSRLGRNGAPAGNGKRGKRAGPTGPQDSMQLFPVAATGRKARPFRSAETAKTATAPTYSIQARPQAPIAYRNGATSKRGGKPRKKPIRSLRGGATR